MILKIKTKVKGNDGWLILGNVTDISYQEENDRKYYNELKEMGDLGDYLLFEAPEIPEGKDLNGNFVPTCDVPVECKIVYFSDKDGEQRKVIFNEVAYIMNDSGKTVETICLN